MGAVAIVGFPNPVNEKAARVVAGGVLLLSVLTMVLAAAVDTTWMWLTAVLAYGFLARVLTGPTLSPLGRFATAVVAPRLGEPKLVPGPPKRFAQAIGAVVTGAAFVLTVLGFETPVYVLLALIAVFATLESVFAFCFGCVVFNGLMRAGVIPADVCEECADVTLRYARAA